MSRKSAKAEFDREYQEKAIQRSIRENTHDEERRQREQQRDELYNRMVAKEDFFSRVEKKAIALTNNLLDILQEEMDYVTPDGKNIKIAGQFNQKDSEGKVISYGTKNVFEKGTPYFGKPFCEVSRNMHAHFKIYCLSHGLTEDELISLADENPPKGVMDKLRGMKKGFFDMVTGYAPEKENGRKEVVDFYVGLCDIVEKKMPELEQLDDLDEGFEKNERNMLLLGGADSYISQTLGLGDGDESEETTKLNEEIRERLSQKGRNYDLHNIWDIMQRIALIDNCNESTLKKPDEKDKVPGFFIREAQVVFYTKLVNKKFSPNDSSAVKIERAANATSHFKSIDVVNFVSAARNGKRDRILDMLISADTYIPYYDTEDTANLYQRMDGNKRRKKNGEVIPNSPKYDAVLKTLEKIAAAEKKFTGKTSAITKKSLRVELQRLYKDLRDAAGTYLIKRNPHSDDGNARYKLVLEAQSVAEHQLKRLDKMTSYLNIAADNEDSMNLIQKGEIEDRNDATITRADAIDQNDKLSEDEKKIENSILEDLYHVCLLETVTGDGSNTESDQKEMTKLLARIGAKAMARARYENHENPMTEEELKNCAKQLREKDITGMMMRRMPHRQKKIITMQPAEIYRITLECIKEKKKQDEKSLQEKSLEEDKKQAGMPRLSK